MINQSNINGYQVFCDKQDAPVIGYKIMGLPFHMRELVTSYYSMLYRSTVENYPREVGQEQNPVIEKLALWDARQRANAYLKTVMTEVKGHIGKESYLETHDRLKLAFLYLWEQHAPAAELVAKEAAGSLDAASAKTLARARVDRRKAVKGFLAAENIAYPAGTNDDAAGNGSRYNRLVNNQWWKKQIRKRTDRSTGERARQSGSISKHGMHYLTDTEYQQWLDAKADSLQYMKDTVFISHEDDEVEMELVYNSTTANPKNRKIQLMTQVAGFVSYAEKHGYSFAMITPTAASEHHPAPHWDNGTLVLNPKYAAKSPKWTVKKTHEHLNAIWERVASALEREGVEFYAFKGVEAHKDGTPHHHYGFFYKDASGNKRKVHKIFTWYYQELDQLAGDLGDYKHRRKITREQQQRINQHLHTTQPGAVKRRVTFVYHDRSKGSLTNYILKSLLNYVVKDVADGADDGAELTPKQQEAATRQQRVAAWAALHGIRQFSTLRTGASVGVYQELRRIHSPVEGSTQLEQERLACVGSYGTEAHANSDTRVNADFARFMELRRNPIDGATAVAIWKEAETESDQLTIKLNEFSDEMGRIKGVTCEEEPGILLEVNTRPIRWRAVNVPQLQEALIERDLPPRDAGDMVKQEDREELTRVWSRIVNSARTDKTLHELARGMYHYPLSNAVGVSFRDRAKPIATWKIINNPTFSGGSAKNAQTPQGASHDHATL